MNLRPFILPVLLGPLLAACGSGGDSSSRDSGGGSAGGRPNVVVTVTGDPREGNHCMLDIRAENRQSKKLNLMLTFAVESSSSAELSSPTMTAAFSAPAQGTGAYPSYSLSGAPCDQLQFTVEQAMCFGGDTCVLQYRADGIGRLTPPPN